MRLIHLLIIVLQVSLLSCSPNFKKNQLKEGIVTHQIVNKIYREDIAATADSIEKYRLDSLHLAATTYIYTIYGREKIVDDRAIDDLFVNNCKIEATNFSIDNSHNFNLHYTIFLNDSIPISPGFKTQFGTMISGIAIDSITKNILYGIVGGTTPVQFNNITYVYDSIKNNDGFRAYIQANHNRFHPKYQKILKIW